MQGVGNSGQTVFPAGAGVSRPSDLLLNPSVRIPRRRGGEPIVSGMFFLILVYSPQARG